MTKRALDPIDHLAGVAAAVVILVFAKDIANAGSTSVSWLLDHLGGRTRFGFVEFATDSTVWAAIGGLALLGGLVVVSDMLVRRGHMRVWVPPLAVIGLAISAFTLLLMGPETELSAAAIMGTGLGAVVSAAFSGWWIMSLSVSHLRGRGSRAPGIQRAG